MKLIFNDAIKAAIAILVWTFIVFSPSLKNDFVYYDDAPFVSSPYTHHLSWENLQATILNNNGDVSMFPLVIFSYALEYHFFKDNPSGYHADNLALHLINVLFVYILIYLISGRVSIAFLTTLLFAINPLRVESVAWIAERKDLLFSFFYLLSLIFYLCAVKDAVLKARYLVLSCALFILSLLSKPQALSLPLVILAIDFLLGKSQGNGRWIWKIPFFIIAVGFFVFSIQPHVHLLKLTDPRIGNDIEKIFLSCDAALIYFLKNFIPIQLSCVNPFPHKINGHFLWIVYAAPMIVIVMGYLFYKFFHKERFVIFGLLFFIINLIMPIKLIWYNWFIGEHYMYLPSIGLSFACAAVVISVLGNNKLNIFKIGNYLLFFYILVLSGATYQYCHVWKDEITLWSNAIRVHPNSLRTSVAYFNRAVAYEKRGNDLQALNDYSSALNIYPDFAEAYAQRAKVLSRIHYPILSKDL